MAHRSVCNREAKAIRLESGLTVDGEVHKMSTRGTASTNFESDITINVPVVDVVSYALARLDEHDSENVIYADATNPNNRIKAGEVRGLIERLVAGLRTHGVKAGDCVCIHSWNTIYYPLLWLAIVSVGGIVTGSNPAYTSSELVHHFRSTNTKFVISHIECLPPVEDAASQCDIPTSKIFTLGKISNASPQRYHSFEHDLLKCNGDALGSVTFADEHEQDTSIAVYATTSGTTGLPKAAELSHRYFVAQTLNLEHIYSTRQEPIRQLISLPVFHAFAAQLAVVLPLRLGIATFLMPRFELQPYLDHVHQLQITDSPLVPAIVGKLLDAPSPALSSLRYLVCAGAPMTAAVQARLSSKLDSSACIAQCWGATELGWITLFDQSERDVSGSIGRLLPNTTLKIIDEHGHPITTDDVPGEGCIRSPSMLRLYRNTSGSTTTPFDHDGYYLTGDRVFMRKGKVFLDGRIKDIMKVNGWQVSPEELERVILQLECVMDCAVIGHRAISHITGLEETKPRALVVRKTTHSLISQEEIRAHVKNNLVGYKQLSGGVIFVDAIPRSNTGKILRKKLSKLDIQHDGFEEVGRCHRDRINGLHIKMMFMVPICLAMGFPGLILLCTILKMVMTVEHQNHRAYEQD